jgi:hypothetical protein
LHRARAHKVRVFCLALADFVVADGPLAAAFESADFARAQGGVFLGYALVHAFAPEVETRALELASHQGNNLGFADVKLGFDRLKRGAVFPSHFNDPVCLDFIQLYPFCGFHLGVTI